jgi:hypothetical protein
MKNCIYSYLIALIGLLNLLTISSCKPDNSDATKNETCDTCIIAYKPNIYIYPDTPKHLLVELNFPKGGKIITSEPLYHGGWSILADTNGLIDNQYRYLFYESYQPNVWQTRYGWVIAKDGLKSFFEQNMAQAGFNSSEIKDFTDYWIPILTSNTYYIVYPQSKEIIDRVIKLKFSENPDHLLRLFYLIEGSDKKINLIQPDAYSSANRDGFIVAEWGVLMK